MAKILTLTLNPALDLTVQLTRLEPGQVNRSDEMHTHAAGKGVNVAQGLADLGHQLTVSGFLGEGTERNEFTLRNLDHACDWEDQSDCQC